MQAEVIKRVKEAKDTYSLIFKPSRPFFFIPGQFIYVTFPILNGIDPRGNTREFSITNSPTEGQLIKITYRIGISAYKKTLHSLKSGDSVAIDGPMGVYQWETANPRPQVFVAGGIGIVPFRSRIKYNIDTKSTTPITLIYSNKSIKSCAFLDELHSWANKFTPLSLHVTLTQEKSITEFLTGRINSLMITTLIKNPRSHTFWICGTNKMVDDIEAMLISLGVAYDNIKTEKFTGY